MSQDTRRPADVARTVLELGAGQTPHSDLIRESPRPQFIDPETGAFIRARPDSGGFITSVFTDRQVTGSLGAGSGWFGGTTPNHKMLSNLIFGNKTLYGMLPGQFGLWYDHQDEEQFAKGLDEEHRKQFRALQAERNLRGTWDNPWSIAWSMTTEFAEKTFGSGDSAIGEFLDDYVQPDWNATEQYESMNPDLLHVLHMNGYSVEDFQHQTNSVRFFEQMSQSINLIAANQQIDTYNANVGILKNITAKTASAAVNYLATDPSTVPMTAAAGGWNLALKGGVLSSRVVLAATSKAARFGGNSAMAGIYSGVSSRQASKAWERLHGEALFSEREITDHTMLGAAVGGLLGVLLTRDIGRLNSTIKSRKQFMEDMVKGSSDLRMTDPAIKTYIQTGKLLDPYTFQRSLSNERMMPLIEKAAKAHLGPRSVRVLADKITLGFLEDNAINAYTVLKFIESRPTDLEVDRFVREVISGEHTKWRASAIPDKHVRWYENPDGTWAKTRPAGRQTTYVDLPKAVSEDLERSMAMAVGGSKAGQNPVYDSLTINLEESGARFGRLRDNVPSQAEQGPRALDVGSAEGTLFEAPLVARKQAEIDAAGRQYEIDRTLYETYVKARVAAERKRLMNSVIEQHEDSVKKGFTEYQPEWATEYTLTNQKIRAIEVGGRRAPGDPDYSLRVGDKDGDPTLNWDEDSIAGLEEIEMHLIHEGAPIPERIIEKRKILEARSAKLQDKQNRDSVWNQISDKTRAKFIEAQAARESEEAVALAVKAGKKKLTLKDMQEIVQSNTAIRNQYLRDLHFGVEDMRSLTGASAFSNAMRRIPIIGDTMADLLFSASTFGTAQDLTVASQLAPAAMLAQLMGPGGLPGRNFLNRSYARQVDSLQSIKNRLDLMPQKIRRMWKALHEEGFVEKHYGGSTVAMNRDISKMITTGVIPEDTPKALIKYMKAVRDQYEHMYKQGKNSGMLKGYQDNYLPREWATHHIIRNFDQFVDSYSAVLIAKHSGLDSQVQKDLAIHFGWVDEQGNWTDKAWAAIKPEHVPQQLRPGYVFLEGETKPVIKANYENTKLSMMTPEARAEYDEMLEQWATIHAERTAKRMTGRHSDEVDPETGFVKSDDSVNDADAVALMHVSPYHDRKGARLIDDDIYLHDDMAEWIQWEHLDVMDSYLSDVGFKIETQALLNDITGMPGITWKQYRDFAYKEARDAVNTKGEKIYNVKHVEKAFDIMDRAYKMLSGEFAAPWAEISNPVLRFGAAVLHRLPNIFFGGWWGLNSLMVEVPWNVTRAFYTSREYGEQWVGMIGEFRKFNMNEIDIITQAVEDTRVVTNRYFSEAGSDTLGVMNHVNQRARLKQGLRNVRSAYQGDIDNMGFGPAAAATDALLKWTGDVMTTMGGLHTTTTVARRFAFHNAMMSGRGLMRKGSLTTLTNLLSANVDTLSALQGRARVKEFNRIAREAGFGANVDVAMRMNEAGLLDHNIIKYIDEYQLFDPKAALDAHTKLPSRVYDPEGYKNGLNAIERHRRFLESEIDASVPTPRIWDQPKTDFGVNPISSLFFKLGSFARKFYAGNVYGRQSTPMAKLMPMIATYAILDTMYGMLRTVLTRDDVSWDDLEQEWLDDPYSTFAKYVVRTPWAGQAAPFQSDILNLIQDTPYPVSFGGSPSGSLAFNILGGARSAISPDKEMTEAQKRVYTGQLPVILIKGLWDGFNSIRNTITDN